MNTSREHFSDNGRSQERQIGKSLIREKKARRVRASRVKLLRPLLDYLRSHLPREWQSRAELRRPNIMHHWRSPEESHRIFAGLFSSILTHPTLRQDFTEFFRAVSDRLSNKTKENITAGNNYFPFVVVGMGTHSSIITSEMLYSDPDLVVQGLGIDKYTGYGGQFAQLYKIAKAFFMNTANIAVGDSRDKNFLGPHAALQLADVGKAYYEDNSTVGLVIAINSFLSGISPLFGSEVTEISENPEYFESSSKESHIPRYSLKISIGDGKFLTVLTDVIAIPSGIGTPTFRFDSNDEETNKVISQSNEDAVNGITPQLLAAEVLNAHLNNPERPFSRNEFSGEEIMVIGSGTSSLTSLESLFRLHGSEVGGAVVRLGNPKKVIWACGREAISANSLLEKFWARYYDLHDVLVEHQEILEPVAGYAHRLAFIEENGKRRIKVYFKGGQTQIVDRVVAATGYESKLEELVRPLLAGSSELDEQLKLILDENGNLQAKKLRGHSIFTSGPSSLTNSEEQRGVADYLRYPIPQAITNFVDGSVALAHKIAEEVRTTVPADLLKKGEGSETELTSVHIGHRLDSGSADNSERESKSILGTLMTKLKDLLNGKTRIVSTKITRDQVELEREWSEGLNFRDVLILQLAEELNDVPINAIPGTVFSIYITESSAFPSRKSAGRSQQDEREFTIELTSLKNADDTPAELDEHDVKILLQAINKNSILSTVASYLMQQQLKPDIEIKLSVNQRKEISARDIVVAQGNF